MGLWWDRHRGCGHTDTWSERQQLFEAMLLSWTRHQPASLLVDETVAEKVGAIRLFASFTNAYPWTWTSDDVAEFWAELRVRGVDRMRLRSYQMWLKLFCDYLLDERYGWSEKCQQRFGRLPERFSDTPDADSTTGKGASRALTRAELQALLKYADEQVRDATALGRKAVLAAFRDAMVLKVAYGWGLRRREAMLLDIADWLPNPQTPKLGSFGALQVRCGLGTPDGQDLTRTVLSLFPWAVTEVRQYLSWVRPLIAGGRDTAMWPTARGNRLSARQLNDVMASYCAAVGLGEGFDLHALRLSYVHHLVDDGIPEQLVCEQVGHADLVRFAVLEE